jgi:TrmH family RNA methyltransferase
LLRELEEAGCRIEVVDDETLDGLTGSRSIGAIVGLARLPRRSTFDELLLPRSRGSRLLLVGHDVEDPGNIGALVRTALASGTAAYVSVGAGDPFHPRAVRTSMGSVLKLPCVHYETLDALVTDLDRLQILKVAAVSSGGTALPETPFGERGVAVLVGSEAFGLPDAVAARMDRRVTVPMEQDVDSFSVNAAAAIVLYEIRRRTTASP